MNARNAFFSLFGLLPAIILLLIFALIIYLLLIDPKQVLELFFRKQSWILFKNTIQLMIGVACMGTLISLLMWYFFSIFDFKNKKLIEAILISPLIIPSYLIAYCLIAFFAPGGLVSKIFSMPGTIKIYGLWGSIWALTIVTYPYLYLTIKNRWQNIDMSIFESARLLSKSNWKTFMGIWIPIMLPAFGTGLLTLMLYALSDFGGVSIMRFDTLTAALYSRLTNSFDIRSASIFVFYLITLASSLLMVEHFLHRKDLIYSGHSHKYKPLKKLDNINKTMAILFFSFLLVIIYGIPSITLIFWGLKIESYLSISKPAINSLIVATLGAGSIVMAIFIVLKHPPFNQIFLQKLVIRIYYLGYSLPGLIIALGISQLALSLTSFWYQSFLVLILAYVVHLAAPTINVIKAHLDTLNPDIENAARLLTKKYWKVFSKITLPLFSPSLISAFVLSFLTILKELPMTMLLAPTGTNTLAMELWAYTEEAMFAEAALPAILLFFIGCMPMLFLNVHKKS